MASANEGITPSAGVASKDTTIQSNDRLPSSPAAEPLANRPSDLSDIAVGSAITRRGPGSLSTPERAEEEVDRNLFSGFEFASPKLTSPLPLREAVAGDVGRGGDGRPRVDSLLTFSLEEKGQAGPGDGGSSSAENPPQHSERESKQQGSQQREDRAALQRPAPPSASQLREYIHARNVSRVNKEVIQRHERRDNAAAAATAAAAAPAAAGPTERAARAEAAGGTCDDAARKAPPPLPPRRRSPSAIAQASRAQSAAAHQQQQLLQSQQQQQQQQLQQHQQQAGHPSRPAPALTSSSAVPPPTFAAASSAAAATRAMLLAAADASYRALTPDIPSIRIWIGTFNMGAKDPVRGKHDNEVRTFVPAGYDIYALGVQEGVSDSFADMVGRHLAKQGVDKLPLSPQVHGRGDGSFLFSKHTGLHLYCARHLIPAVRVVSHATVSLGMTEGSKGAAAIGLHVAGTTLAFVTCHLPANSLPGRRAAFRYLIEQLGTQLGDPYFQFTHQVSPMIG